MRFDYTIYYIVAILDVAKAVVSAHFDSSSIIDLMQHVGRNVSHSMMKPIPGSNGRSTAYYLQGSSRHIEVSHRILGKVKRLIEDNEGFTLLTSIKQQEKNSGSIISFTSHNSRYLEVESSGRRNELRLHYTHHGHIRTETFPYRLADNQWHQLALGFSRQYVEVFIDCKKVYERRIESLDETLRASSMAIWLGQKDASHAPFKGAIEYIKMAADPQGVLHQCPHANVACPTCSQFRHLEHSIGDLYKQIQELNMKLSTAERRISELEECDCQRSCDVNGTRYRDGETWDQHTCVTCQCKNGTVECREKVCQTNCSHPVTIPGTCCPVCLKNCYVKETTYEHGVKFTPTKKPCVQCRCENGKPHCSESSDQCPELNCPESERASVPGKCCKVCQGTDFCALGNDCHHKATCHNIETKFTCECKPGFEGDGRHCQDIDECQEAGGERGHHCDSNTQCRNTNGFYVCICQPGYLQIDAYRCDDHNECVTGQHRCHVNATCVNTPGSYRCDCAPGFHGNGFKCKPVCEEHCTNGGICLAPGLCQCRKGFAGLSCAEDLDECALGMGECHSNAVCVNHPGSYSCQCKPGFYSSQPDNHNGKLCEDIDECSSWSSGHDCPSGTTCVNTNGSYTCVCLNSSCRPSGTSGACHDAERWHPNGSSWSPVGQQCTVCMCHNGEKRCQRKSCDCSSEDVDLACCQECTKVGQCRYYGLLVKNGHRWMHKCRTCHCLNGEVDCWLVSCPQLTCGRTVIRDGDCCPQCEDDHDPCQVTHHQGALTLPTKSCYFNKSLYLPGRTWRLQSSTCPTCSHCTRCECKGGHVCCEHDERCSRRHSVNTQSPSRRHSKRNRHGSNARNKWRLRRGRSRG